MQAPLKQLLALALLLLGIGSQAVEVPPGFVAETLATNLNAATAIAAARDGRIFIADQTGRLLLWKNGKLLDKTALTLHVTDYWERGLIGVTLDPGFEANGQIYLFYVTDRPYVHHVLSRFQVQGDEVELNSERILWEGDDQSKVQANLPAGHQGGPIRFGQDGKLYIGIGEQTAGAPSQQLDTFLGKILRLNSDGSIPDDNPFYARTAGRYRAIFAFGVRNPFGLAVQPDGRRIFFTDVGASAFEEVNELLPGANYGWPKAEGYSNAAGLKGPLYAYSPVVGQSIVGGAFLPKASAWPGKWKGRFFFADFMRHWVKALDPENPTNALTFARGLNGPVATELTAEGGLLILNRGAVWRDPKKFVANAGDLIRIKYTGSIASELVVEGRAALGLPLHARNLPQRLSETGLASLVRNGAPGQNVLEFQPNLAPWEPGVSARHFLAVGSGTIIFSREGEWKLPVGTALVRHFTTRSGEFLETRIFVQGPECAYGAAYRWQEDGQDAQLVMDPELSNGFSVGPGGPRRFWMFPGVEDCIRRSETSLAFRPMLTAGQMIRPAVDNPLTMLVHRGLIEGAEKEDQLEKKLAHWSDAIASLELRVRSYLDVHCAVCHQPGGASRGLFDARISTPLAQARMIQGVLAAGDLGIPGARVIVPGDPARSVIYQRLKAADFFRMPPVQYHSVPSPILPLLEEWIRSLASQQAKP